MSGNRLPRRVARQHDGDGQQRPPGRRAIPGIASLLSAVGLVVVAVLSYGLLGGPLPDIIPIRELHPGDVPNRTPNPVVVYTPVAAQPPHVVGTILFVKAGNIWSVSGDDQLTRLTSGGTDQTPTWSPDGKTIYFVHLLSKKTQVPCSYIAAGGCVAGSAVNYTLEYPVLSSMADAPGASSTAIESGLYSLPAGGQYFYGLWQPSLSPDGTTFALLSDAPDPFNYSVALSTLPVGGGRLTRLSVGEADYYGYGLGQNDPQWSPDGSAIAYTYNDKAGAYGAPRIAVYDVKTRTASFLTTNGYAQPSWSPDGRYLAAVRTTARGRDVVILDSHSGKVLATLTHDARSFAPTWSPAGNQIAFLRAVGATIDLQLITLGGTAPRFTVAELEPLTSQSQLDGTSRPVWYVPPSQLPTAAPTSPAAASGLLVVPGNPAASSAAASAP
ncbi:MAG: TolB family protein [Candidatus Limnocylindrales bacterium]